jgi:hypothetical protein
MFKRRFRLPSPALVVSMLALAVALGGTAFAANSAATKSRHKDKKADTKLIRKLAPTLSVKHAKSADSATTAASATHAATADSATKATTATTATSATNATNASKLGGVAASSYLTNGGTIFVTTGLSAWHALNTPADPIDFFYGGNSTAATATAAGNFYLVAHPSLPTALYGKKLEVTSATLCYSASTNAKIDQILVSQNTFSNGGNGDSVNLVVNEKTRTGSACVVFPVIGSPVPLSTLDDIDFSINADFKSGGDLDIGQSGLTLAPTTTAASAR